MHGLDPTRDDAQEDADGDGLPNIGEYRAETDPQNADTDGDGVGDLAEMVNLRDPLVAEEEPVETRTLLSVETFDATGASATTFMQGDVVKVVATFDAAVTSGRITLEGTNGVTLVASGAMTPDGATLVFSWTATSDYFGPVNAKLTVPECDPSTADRDALFEVSAPAEEYEETPWRITSITIADGKATLTWSLPTAGVPAAGACDFRVEWRTSLIAGTWSAAANSFVIEGVTAAAGCTKTIPLSDIGNPAPASCFFRLFWTNKVKGVDP